MPSGYCFLCGDQCNVLSQMWVFSQLSAHRPHCCSSSLQLPTQSFPWYSKGRLMWYWWGSETWNTPCSCTHQLGLCYCASVCGRIKSISRTGSSMPGFTSCVAGELPLPPGWTTLKTWKMRSKYITDFQMMKDMLGLRAMEKVERMQTIYLALKRVNFCFKNVIISNTRKI